MRRMYWKIGNICYVAWYVDYLITNTCNRSLSPPEHPMPSTARPRVQVPSELQFFDLSCYSETCWLLDTLTKAERRDGWSQFVQKWPTWFISWVLYLTAGGPTVFVVGRGTLVDHTKIKVVLLSSSSEIMMDHTRVDCTSVCTFYSTSLSL